MMGTAVGTGGGAERLSAERSVHRRREIPGDPVFTRWRM
jgi:hypothetical protein